MLNIPPPAAPCTTDVFLTVPSAAGPLPLLEMSAKEWNCLQQVVALLGVSLQSWFQIVLDVAAKFSDSPRSPRPRRFTTFDLGSPSPGLQAVIDRFWQYDYVETPGELLGSSLHFAGARPKDVVAVARLAGVTTPREVAEALWRENSRRMGLPDCEANALDAAGEAQYDAATQEA